MSGRRSQSRLRVRLPARLTTLDGTVNAILTDLSISGAKLANLPALPVGKEALLQWNGHEAFGRVSWSHDGLCGLRFADPVAPEVLFATRDLDDAAHLPGERVVAQARARGIARDWVMGKDPD